VFETVVNIMNIALNVI